MTPLQRRHAAHHIDRILSVDVTEYVRATRRRQMMEDDEKRAGVLMFGEVSGSFDALHRLVKKLLAPHAVEWRAPDVRPSIDWTKEGTPHAWLYGSVFPRRHGKYTTHASLQIQFSMQPRDAEEMQKVTAALKAAADAMADAL